MWILLPLFIWLFVVGLFFFVFFLIYIVLCATIGYGEQSFVCVSKVIFCCISVLFISAAVFFE